MPLLLSTPLWAAEEDPALVYDICGSTGDAKHPWSWRNVERTFRRELDGREYQAVLGHIHDAFLNSPLQADAEIRSRFAAEAQDIADREKPCCASFDIIKRVVIGKPERLLLFANDPAREIDLKACDLRSELRPQLDELRYFAHAYKSVGDRMSQAARRRTAEQIRRIEERFDRYLFQGFPMFPWEAVVNGWCLANKHVSDGPPRVQAVLGHLGGGMEASTSGLAAAKPRGAISIEPLGFVHYPEKADYASWWGASTLVTLQDGAGFGAGFSMRYRHFAAGLSWHDSQGRGGLFKERPSVFLNMDLYQFLGEKARSYQGYRDKVRALATADPEQ